MAEGNLTAAIKHVAVVTSSKWNGENDTERPHWVVPPESLFSGKDERKARTDGNLDYRGDRLYILSIDPEVTKKLVDGREYYFKWDKLELKNKYGSDMLSAVNTVVSVIQWTGEIGRDSTANGIALTKVITVSKTTGNKNGGNLTFTYRRDSDRPCVSLLVTTGVAESKFKYPATLSVQFGSDTKLELTGLDEPQDTNAIDTNELIISNSYYTNRYADGGFYSYTNQNSRAKCALKIPDKLLKPSTTYKVTFDLSSSRKLHNISTGVNFGDKRISSDAKAADKTYTMTFTTPEVLSGDKVLFFAAATVEDRGSGAKTITIENLIIAPVPKPKPHPKFNLKLEANNSTIKTDETAKLTTTFTNTGNIDLHNANITAALPAGLSLAGAIEPKEITGDLLQGVKLPTISPDKSVVLSFNVKPNARLLKIGDNPLSVTLNATTDELGQEPDTADNTVTLTVHKPESKFNLKLEVDKSTIKVKETAKLTATFANIGETDLHDIVITGTLPDVVNLASPIESKGTTGNLQQGIRMPVVTPSKSVALSFVVKPDADLLDIGDNKVTIALSATTKELEQEPDTADNSVDITIQKPEPPKLRPEEVREIKLANNEILDDNRRELIKPIFKAVKGLSFTPLEITTEGHGWYEIGDRITIENDKEQWQAVITNIKLAIDGGIKEEIKSIAPTATTTNYALAGGIKKTIYNTEIKVDKQKQKIEQIVSRQDKQDTDIKESFTRVKQDLRGINTTIQETGGNNLIYNSVGFDANNSGKLTSWATTGSAKGQSSLESVASGGNSGNQITLDKSTKIVQRLTVKRGGKYALSFRARKGASGVAKISLKNTIDDYQIVLEDQHEVMWSDSINKIIVPSEGYFDVIVETDANVAYFAITDLMLNTGDSPVQWVQASGEVLSTGVSVTKQGMKVKSSLHNGDYVEMTPLEFAGYSTVGGSLQRVFSLNRDVTTVQKLSAVKRISMPPIKIVPIEKGEQAGWAFVKTTEE